MVEYCGIAVLEVVSYGRIAVLWDGEPSVDMLFFLLFNFEGTSPSLHSLLYRRLNDLYGFSFFLVSVMLSS